MNDDARNYRTFIRSATNWHELARARKSSVRRNLSAAEARRMCDEFNSSRTPAQIRKGTKMEFESQ